MANPLESSQHSSDDEGLPAIHLPAREVPAPASLSPQGRALLGVSLPESPPYPALDDLEGWRSMSAAQEAAMRHLIADHLAGAAVEVEETECEGVPLNVITPDGTTDDDRRLCLSIHGGGFITGAGSNGLAMCIGDALQLGARTWAVDYRMPPDDPYPAPLDDCVAAYRSALEIRRPDEIVVRGVSAGGNLAADGGVFAFGDAPYVGGSVGNGSPVVTGASA